MKWIKCSEQIPKIKDGLALLAYVDDSLTVEELNERNDKIFERMKCHSK